MPPRAGVKHLTEAELAERWHVSPQLVAIKRKNGNGEVPPYLPLTESATNSTIRYRLADVEAWEAERLVGADAKATA